MLNPSLSIIMFIRTVFLMNKDEKFEKIQQQVDYLEDEGFAEEAGVRLTLFRNAKEAMQAIRNNEVEGVTWTDECEAKFQARSQMYDAIDQEDPWDLV